MERGHLCLLKLMEPVKMFWCSIFYGDNVDASTVNIGISYHIRSVEVRIRSSQQFPNSFHSQTHMEWGLRGHATKRKQSCHLCFATLWPSISKHLIWNRIITQNQSHRIVIFQCFVYRPLPCHLWPSTFAILFSQKYMSELHEER